MLNIIQKRIPWQLSLLRNWLKRSGVLSLSIEITFDAEGQETAPPSIANIIEGLVVHCRRWEYMEILLPFEYLHLIRGDMPGLRSLTIGPSAVPESEPSLPLALFTSCPKLQHIVLSRFFQPTTITLCWETLTRLEGVFLTPQESLEILRQTVNITHFKSRIESSGDDLTPVLALFKLECLILLPGEETIPDDSQMQLLDSLLLPVLRSLTLMGRPDRKSGLNLRPEDTINVVLATKQSHSERLIVFAEDMPCWAGKIQNALVARGMQHKLRRKDSLAQNSKGYPMGRPDRKSGLNLHPEDSINVGVCDQTEPFGTVDCVRRGGARWRGMPRNLH
ncbi:hypothetical protein B0H11DRAFT_1916510 [Mycena galericulata]|nr:hypothetical protein B0H11DRAFT_1916510 [Mycena galericulata]